jgi:predicted RNA-binding protein with PUA-like domain
MAYWLLKSEPFKYSWEQLEKDKKTFWDGVRNYAGLEIVGIVKIIKEAYQDPTTKEEAWVAVDVAPFKKLKKPVTLAQIKSDKRLQNIALVKLSRLSVQPVTSEEWDFIIELAS